MQKMKWFMAIIFTITSTSSFAQLRGTSSPGTVSTAPTLPPSNSTGTATYGADAMTSNNGATSTAPVATTPAATTTETSAAGGYTPIVTNSSGIQSAGKSSSGNNNIGIIAGIGATAYAGYNAAACCISENTACALGLSCPMWVAGTLAAIMVTGYMMTAKNQSDGTVAATTDPTAGASTGSGASATGTNGNGLSAVAYNQDPAWQNAQGSISKLKALGWNVDPSTGIATGPNGQTINAANLSSPAAMQAAGYSASDIKGFQNIMGQAEAAGKKLAASRGADASGSLFDGVAGGSKTAGVNANGMAGFGSALKAASMKQNLGVNRDPAQVAGMSKSFNGEQIGVAQDSLFNMIDRRYQLHER